MIAIYGPAGVGKSTQAQILARKLGREWLSAGQIIRDSGKFQDFTAKSAFIDEGILVSMICEAVGKAGDRGVVFDGQPGTPEQVGYWKEAGLLDGLECVVVLRADEDVLVKRLEARGREDDNLENWKTKFKYFEQKICSFLTEFDKQKIAILEVDANGEMNEVADKIWGVVRDFVKE